MFKGKTSKKKGLTLLELVIVLGLMSLVTMLVFSFTNTTQRKSKELEIRQELQHEGTMITESFMSNVLQTEGITAITLENAIPNVNEKLFIKNIEFKMSNGKIKNIENIVGVIYEKDSNDLKLKAKHIEDPIANPTVESIKDIQNVSTYLTSIEILNPEVKKYVVDKNMVADGVIPVEAFKGVKNINFKITLEDDYYGKPIYHEHVMELNLRNAK